MSTPPPIPHWLVRWSLPDRDRDAVLGDLAEEFDAIASREGHRRAVRWYWRQAFTSLVPNLYRRLTTHAPRLTPRASRKGRIMDSLWQDVRFGWRLLVRRPLVSIVAVLSLATGIGAATIVYSLLDAAVLRALPVSTPAQLALVLEQRDTGTNHNFSYIDYTDFRAGMHAFTDLFAYERVDATLRESGASRVVAGEIVTGGYFSTLGIRLKSGRALSDDDGKPGAQPAVVVSETLARRVSSGTVILNGTEFAIVGIAAAPFQGMEIGREAQFWAPLEFQPVLDPDGGRNYLSSTTISWLSIMGRLRTGTSIEQANADLNHLETTLPRTPNRPRTRRFTLEAGAQGDSGLPKAMASPLQMLLAAAGFVLLIACANVANLMVARTTDRSREIAIRTALGAGRWRIARLLLVETLLVSASGAALALVVAQWAAKLALPLMPAFGGPPSLDVGLNWRVFAFSGALALAATMVAAAAPVARVLRRAVSRSLGDAGRSATAAPSANRLRQGIVIAQFTLSLALVVSATLLVRTLINVRAIPTGFDIDHVALLSVDPEKAQYDAPRTRQYLDAAVARLAAIPGVRAVGYGRVIPVGFGGSRTTIDVVGYQPRPDEDMEINFNVISPSYFAATGITLADGRALTDADVLDRPLVAIVNETMARHFWPGASAIGRQFHFGGNTGPLFEVAGVAHDVKYRMLREDAAPSFYYSVAQSKTPRGGVLHVRVTGDPAEMLETLRRTAAAVDPLVPVTSARTLRAQADLNVNDERMAMTIGVSLGSAALLLAAVGLYGAMAYIVGQRTREIGVRMALGANPADMRRLMLKQGVLLAVAGSGVGIALALWCGRLIESKLYDVRPYDPISVIASVVLLSGVAIFASWAPARRAASVDPVVALRVD